LVGILKATEKKDSLVVSGTISENQHLLLEGNANLTEEPQEEVETKQTSSLNLFKLPVQFWSLCVVILGVIVDMHMLVWNSRPI
jgi:hypothetical protein